MPNSPVIVAVDTANLSEAIALADQLSPSQCRLKIGKAMFTRSGIAVIEALHQRGFEVFLDLKYHDIPNTVADAVSAAADLGVWMVNVHASGGQKMLATAAERLAQYHHRPLLIAVTVLTSLSEIELAAIGIRDHLDEQVNRLARLSYDCGLDGVVCSAHEASAIKERTAQSFLAVTPGIRPEGTAVNDQSRIMTPKQALAAGSDYLVIGRPITASSSPAEMLLKIYQSITGE